MTPIAEPVNRALLLKELTTDKLIRYTRKGNNEIYDITAHNSPNVMREIARLRECSFRAAGGGTGNDIDIDSFDTSQKHPYHQIIVWDPQEQEIIGGYRYILGWEIPTSALATSELFEFSEEFTENYLPYTIELGRSFVQPAYQGTCGNRKGLFSLDNLWDGLGALIMKYSANCKYFFGKVTMYKKYDTNARNILLNFMDKYFHGDKRLVTPIKGIDIDSGNPVMHDMFENMDYKEAYKKLFHELKNRGEYIPPLINSYMNLSPTMKVFGTSDNIKFGNVEETAILITIHDIFPDKLDRHTTPLREWAQRIKYKWWKIQIKGLKNSRKSRRKSE